MLNFCICSVNNLFECLGEISETFYLKVDLVDILHPSGKCSLLPAAMLTWRERSADGPCKIKRTCSQQGRLEAVCEAVGMQCAIS